MSTSNQVSALGDGSFRTGDPTLDASLPTSNSSDPTTKHPIWSAIQSLLPHVQMALAEVAAGSGNPTLLNQLNLENENRMRQQEADQRAQLLQSNLKGQNLQQQREQQEIANYQTPAQKQAMELETRRKLLGMQPPELVPTTGENGDIKYFQRSYNQDTNSYDLTPAMVTQQQTISSPDHVVPPFAPDQTVTQPSRSQLLSRNPEAVKSAIELQREIAFATDPRVQQGKIDVSAAEGRARANYESNLARGSNAALSAVPPHLIAPATEAAQKAGEAFTQAQQAGEEMHNMVSLAKQGNKVAYAYSPVTGVLQINVAGQIKRMNMPEIESYGGAGSALDNIKGWLGKKATGASIPDDVLNDMDTVSQMVTQGARTKYQRDLAVTNQNYGSSFKPVEMQSLPNSGNRPPLSSFEH